ncbi:phage major capsid protein [Orbus wheelerorum]|uniref:phage major capsid protein n=1 Tax=Orbus wheelerorum TaxID=3074111 RepID=UPI00370D4134
MALDNKDVELVAQELKGQFETFKQANDKRIDAVTQEKAVLAEKVDGLNQTISELVQAKSDMEAELKSMKRPNGQGANVSEHKEAFMRFIKKGDEAGLAELERKAMQTGSDSDGGFAVPTELNTDILAALKDQVVMRQEATVITVGTEEWKKLVNLGGTSSGWVGEIDKRPETGTSKLTEIKPIFGEIYGNPQATQRMLDDAFFSVEQFITNELVQNFAESEEIAFTSGDGTNKPKGFLAYATDTKDDKTRDWGKLQTIAPAKSGIVTGDDLLKLIYTQRKVYRAGSKFMLNNQTLFQVRLLKDSNGNYLWQPGLQLGQPSSILGYAAAENEQMPDVGDEKSPIAFGDFKRSFYIFDRIGIRMLRDPYTNKPFVGFYTTKRVGSMLADSNAIKLLDVGKISLK